MAHRAAAVAAHQRAAMHVGDQGFAVREKSEPSRHALERADDFRRTRVGEAQERPRAGVDQPQPARVPARRLEVEAVIEDGFQAIVLPVLRVGTTGTEVGPSVFDCLTILGRAEALRRIDKALALVS